MSISPLLTPIVPTLHTTDSGNRALELMEESHFDALPLVDDDVYLGLIKEQDILEWDTPESLLAAPNFANFKPAIFIESHPYEALTMARQMNVSVLPVIDQEHKYIGAVTDASMMKYFADSSGINNPGGIIVLEVLPRNYSLCEIARICENEDVMVLNTQVRNALNGNLEVTLKTNRTSLEALASSFERHEYTVMEVYGDKNDREDLIHKYHLLMNYLNM